MRWEPLHMAAEVTGLTRSQIRCRGARGTWPRKRANDGNVYLYGVPETMDERESLLGGDARGRGPEDEEGPEGEGTGAEYDSTDSEKPKPYVVIGDNYVFNIPSKPRHPWVVPSTTVKRLVAMYSRDGDDATINMISRELGWHRKTVMETLRALGKTHDSAPFTDEDIAATAEEDLVEDLVRRKEEKVHVRAARIDWRKTKDLADKARRWEDFVKNSLSQMSVDPPPPMPGWKMNRYRKHGSPLSEESRVTIVTHPTDLHYGKSGWLAHTGEEFDRDICRQRLRDATNRLIERVSVFGEPQRVILGVGGDWFHIDNHNGTTTKGTPQDHDGSWLRIFQEGCSLGWDLIETWRSAVPYVTVCGVRGNHDYMSTALMVHWLQAKYQSALDVDIGRSEVDREYLRVGNTILGLTHGDAVKDKDLVSLMAYEAKDIWAETRYRLWLTGHWHTQMMMEHHGVLVEHLPSLAGTDAWHSRHGYVGNRKALIAHVIDDTDGPIARVIVDCD